MAAADSVNGLAGEVREWLEGTSAGRGVWEEYDKAGRVISSDVREVMLYQYNQDSGAYELSERVPVTSRADVIRAVRDLGGR